MEGTRLVYGGGLRLKLQLPIIRHDHSGFEALAFLHAQVKDCIFDDVEIDMSPTTWFDADMCAPFGAMLYLLGDKLNTVSLVNIKPEVSGVLSKNGFLSHYGRRAIPDSYGTTISYQRLDIEDDRYFSDYIEREFIRHSEMPKMSVGLLKKFRESIFEIFSNAVQHSGTELGVFSCGQFFPKRNRLDFTVADLGIGIPHNVRQHLRKDMRSEEAIEWATAGNNTTKQGNIPGGLGLKLLCEFVDLNGGSVQIVSDSGYWTRKGRKSYSSSMVHAFPGTVVCVEIDTADPHSYMLTSETDTHDIF